MKINYIRNNSVKLRNFTESNDKHDILKLLICRMLRRNYPDSKKVQIYTEYAPECPNEHYPDVCIIFNKKVRNKWVSDEISYEIQDKITSKWKKQILERYKDKDLIIVPLKEFPDDIHGIKKELEKYII